MSCDSSTFYIQPDKKDGIVKLDALLYGVVDPEHDIFLTGDFNSRTSNSDYFIPLGARSWPHFST